MKFKNCFIDENGNIYKDESLRKASKDIPVTDFNISSVSLNTIIRWNLVNVRDYIVHYNRVTNADLSVPIIVRSDGQVMDGWHRIIKAKVTGVKKIKQRRFKKDQDPVYDFKTQE